MNWPSHEKLQHLRDLENTSLRKENKPQKAEKIDDIGPDIKAAIWAWTNFGGIGSRTRRGCGALFCQVTAPTDIVGIGKWYRDHLLICGLDQQQQRTWPTLPANILIDSTNGKPIDQWAKAIEVMRVFRQGVGIGRNQGSSDRAKMPGRSRWPEPEAIRRFSKSRLPRHQRLTGIPDRCIPKGGIRIANCVPFQRRSEKG